MSVKDRVSPRRDHEIVQARQLICLLSVDAAEARVSTIARLFNRDHSTIIHAIRQARRKRDISFEYADLFNQLKSKLERAVENRDAPAI